MHGKDLLINDGGNGQAVEAIGKRLPKLNVVTALALIVEAVDSVNGSTFVVTTQDEEILGVLNLVSQEQTDSLERLLATIYVIT